MAAATAPTKPQSPRRSSRLGLVAVPAAVALLMVLTAGCPSSDAPVQDSVPDAELVVAHNDFAGQVERLGGQAKIHLIFDHSSITDSDLAGLEFPDGTVNISLVNTPITDRGIAELLRARNLRSVSLARTLITDAAADQLKQLPLLEKANLQAPGVSRQTMVDMARFFRSRANKKSKSP